MTNNISTSKPQRDSSNSVTMKVYVEIFRYLLPFILTFCCFLFARYAAPYYSDLFNNNNQQSAIFVKK